MQDGIIIGAGPAGIAAARALRDAGLDYAVLEARNRVGGRAFTGEIKGQRIDFGAHWFELPEERMNRRIMAAMSTGKRRTTGDVRLHGLDTAHSQRAFWKHWRRIEDALYDFDETGADESAASRLDRYWRSEDVAWRSTLDFHLALECGRPLSEVSCRDYFHHEETEYFFIDRGYGSLIESLAAGLSIKLNCQVTAVNDFGDRFEVVASDQIFETRAVIVAVPAPVLASGAIIFGTEPSLMTSAAQKTLGRAMYERVIIHWPDSPLHEDGHDCLQIFRGDAVFNTEILSCVDGSDFHYCELGGNAAAQPAWSNQWKQDFAMNFLREQFGSDAAHAQPVHISDWGNDPFSLCSWTVCPPGGHAARTVMRDQQNPRLQFAGEYTSLSHWGTVTGAWLEGVRVAQKMVAAGARA